MEKYKSQYPTLRQAKTRWSKPSIIAKQGEGPSHDWFDMMRKDAKAKLAASILAARTGHVREETDEQHIYHVTHTKHVDKIRKQGIMPMKTSNWVKAGDKERYGGGEVYAFTHKDDAHQWAGRMDWAHHQTLGSGKISIITAKRPSDRKFEVDHNDPLSQAGKKGDWLKTHGSIEPHHIVAVEPYHPKKLGEDKVAVFQHDTQLQNVRMKETGVKRKKKQKEPRPVDWKRADLKESVESKTSSDWTEKAELDTPAKNYTEWKAKKMRKQIQATDESKDLIGKQTPSIEAIAKKHGKDVAEIQAQVDKGIKVEREHTNSDAEAHEIARDHLDEFPDYYDRLDKMEKKAKKDMKEDVAGMAIQTAGALAAGLAAGATFGPAMEKLKKKLRAKGVLKPKVKKPVKEGYNPEREQMLNRIEAHKEVAKKMAQRHGEKSREAAFHRALVKRWEREMREEHLKEDVPNSVGGGNIAGMPTADSADLTPVRRPTNMVRRKKFAGKQVFVVDPTTFHKAYLGKRKYEHYEKYLEGCDIAEEIREYGRTYWAEPIIIENEQTGAMVYLKYGSK